MDRVPSQKSEAGTYTLQGRGRWRFVLSQTPKGEALRHHFFWLSYPWEPGNPQGAAVGRRQATQSGNAQGRFAFYKNCWLVRISEEEEFM